LNEDFRNKYLRSRRPHLGSDPDGESRNFEIARIASSSISIFFSLKRKLNVLAKNPEKIVMTFFVFLYKINFMSRSASTFMEISLKNELNMLLSGSVACPRRQRDPLASK